MDLILTLYALVALQLEPNEIPAAFKQLRSKAVAYYYELIPGLEEAIGRFLKGDEDFGDLPAGLRSFTREYEKTPNAKASTVALLKAFVSWMSTSNENAFKRLGTAAAEAGFPAWVNQSLTTTLINQDPINIQLKDLVKRMTRGAYNGTGFKTTDEAAAAKALYPKLYAEFLALRKQHAQSWKASLAQFVKESGEKTVPYVDLMRFFKKNGIEHSMPTGFTGNIDAAGKWYSQYNEIIEGVPSIMVFPTVRMNAKYSKGSTEYVCVGVRADGTEGNYFYTQATKKSNTLQKFSKVKDFSAIVKSVRKNWVQLIMKGDAFDRKTIAAVVLELLYQFSARVGTKATEHNGVSSLTLGHYTETDSGFILKYLGKDGVPTRHIFKAVDPLTKKIASIVKVLATHPDKRKKDFLFTYNLKTGSFKLVQAGVVTQVFRQCGAGQLSVHKLRTFHATELMKKELERVYANRTKFKNTSDALAMLKKLAMKVGKDLNHVRRNALGESSVTPNTALANYIDVSLQVAFFQHYQLPVPKYLEKYVAHPELLMSFTYITGEGEPGDEQSKENEYQRQTVDDEDSLDKQEHERKTQLDAEDAELNRRLERDAERIATLLTKGGEGAGNVPESGQFDNVLV